MLDFIEDHLPVILLIIFLAIFLGGLVFVIMYSGQQVKKETDKQQKFIDDCERGHGHTRMIGNGFSTPTYLVCDK